LFDFIFKHLVDVETHDAEIAIVQNWNVIVGERQVHDGNENRERKLFNRTRTIVENFIFVLQIFHAQAILER
jgi:hypothetical protein